MSFPNAAVPRLPLLLGGGLCLGAGLVGGAARLGALPGPESAAAAHGLVMTLGFLGTVIALERAVALRRPWGYLAPALSALGGLSLAVGAPPRLGVALLGAAGGWLAAIYLAMWQTAPALSVGMQAVGAVAWWCGLLAWLRGASMPLVSPWLAVFLVATIVGERLELARVVVLTRRVQLLLLAGIAMLVAGAALTAPPLLDLVSGGAVTIDGVSLPSLGGHVLGAGLVAVSAWLARYDVARRTIRATGVAKYMAACLLAGYAWLLVAGLLWLSQGEITSGGAYDAALHAVFLGFAMSMVFGHAPVILPAVLRIPLPHQPRDYAVLAFLHVALLVRLGLGDGLGLAGPRVVGGIATGLSLLVFVVSSAAAALGARRATPSPPPVPATLHARTVSR